MISKTDIYHLAILTNHILTNAKAVFNLSVLK